MWSNKFIRHSRQCEEKFAKGIDLIPEARLIREEVFVREQGFKNEFDEIDKTAWHCVIFVEGRVAVIKSERGTGLGSLIISTKL